MKVETTHEFSKNDKCVACGLMLKNVVKKPVCKVLTNNKPKKIKVPSEPKKKVAHKFKDGWCQHCDVRDFDEHKHPWCKMKYKEALPAPGKLGKLAPACHSKHPVLKFGELEIHGGSCTNPKVKECDVYIGFDSSMKKPGRQSAPWRRGQEGYVEEVYHHVQDYHAPKSGKEFKLLVEWTLEQMKAGKKVHAGCIGGHGRTGTFFAAIAAMQTEVEIEDAIMWVREHYCKKAVENAEQIKFLTKHFGVKTKATGSKSFTVDTKATKKWDSKYKSNDMQEIDALLEEGDYEMKDVIICPSPTAGNVWGRSLDEEDL